MHSIHVYQLALGRKQKTLKSDVVSSPKAESSKQGATGGPSPENEKRKRSTAASDDSEGRPNKRAREHAPVLTPQPSPPHQKAVKPIPLPGRSGNRASHPTVPKTDTASLGPTRHKQKRLIRASSIDEIVPASDDETDDMDISISQVNNVDREAILKPHSERPARQLQSNQIVGSSPQATTRSIPTEDEDVLFTDNADASTDARAEDRHTNIPSHRARAANPLVKMVEPPSVPDVEKAIPVKARLLRGKPTLAPSASGTTQTHSGRSTHASGSKPGPGRSSTGFVTKKTPKNKSSILTVEKGTLKSVKGKYRKLAETKRIEPEVQEDNVEEDSSLWGDDAERVAGASYSQVPPTAEELLDLAGLDVQNAEALPDFEEDLPSTAPTAQPTSQPGTLQPVELEEPHQPVLEPEPLSQSHTDQAKSSLQQRSVRSCS